MQALIQHYLSENLPEVLSRSLLNCHTKGLHSIMLSEVKGKTIRLYIADKTHELWKNEPWMFETGMSVGFHPHHCNLTLATIHGVFSNWTVREAEFGVYGEIKAGKYVYQSLITTGEMGFEKVLDAARLTAVEYRTIPKGQSLFMRASEIHTVVVPKGESAAWLVFEGEENPDYEPICYSTSDLRQVDRTGLYITPTIEQIKELLNQIGVQS